jgi:hypothetical protein
MMKMKNQIEKQHFNGTLITGVDTEYSMYVMCRVMSQKPGATRCTKNYTTTTTHKSNKNISGRICARCTFMGEKTITF